MLERKSLCEQAYRLLAERIIGGRYLAGARLTEEALATEFGISRTPLREALRRLTAEGLIEPLPKRGLRVVAPTPEEVAELFDCRSRIEPQLLREALPRIPTSELRELRKRIETGGPEESLAVDEAMHRLIAEHCGNRFFREIALNLLKRSAPYRTLRNCAIPETPRSERIGLLDAMIAGDAETAAELLARHFRFAETDPKP